ncbi:MAG: FAD-binding oxidoreductase, partial [Gammaproteobacteria bacterium]|nr:FAD-binding oxidoreductase [Gammaproteobacteria bacterium]
PVLNLRDRMPGLAAATEKSLGLAARRSLPAWRRDPFRGRAELARPAAPGARPAPAPAPPQDAAGAAKPPRVVLLADTFNRYFEPENLRAAVAVLGAAGCDVDVAEPAAGDASRPLCCGRTYLAAGMIEEARAEARRLVNALAPVADEGAAIVGLEPACLLGLRDELPGLLPGGAAVRVGGAALLFEEFLVREQRAGRLHLPLRPAAGRRALVHGHCHQKAFGAMGSVVDALRLVPELEVSTLASSCCGMAGAFGYDTRYIDVSMQMAEASLLPAVRAAGPDTLVVADGTSCRHQIRDGAARDARHVARVLADAL